MNKTSHDKITFYIGISFPGHYLDVECQNNRKLEWFYFQNGGPQHTETLPRHLGDLLSFRGRTVIALACYSVFWIFMTSHANQGYIAMIRHSLTTTVTL